MQPMRVRAYLLDGRIAGTEPFFPLDSILAAEWIRRQLPDKFYNPPPPGSKQGWIESDLPLERRGQGDKWYYACSFNQTRPLREYTHYWHRRFDDVYERHIDLKGHRGKVKETRGQYKAYRTALNIMLLPCLEWYAVGDIEAVRELCSEITAVGKKQSQGFGLVERWEIMPWPQDWSEVGPNGRLMRAVPKDSGTAYWGVRPPYWRKENQCICEMPL